MEGNMNQRKRILIIAVLLSACMYSQGLEKTAGWEILFSDDFETDFGWPNWRLETPVGNYNWNRSTYNVNSGTYSLWCAGKNLNGAPKLNPAVDDYASPMDAYAFLIDPVDLTNCTDAEIVFNVWHKTDINDFFEVLANHGGNVLTGYHFDQSSDGWDEIHLSFKDWPGIGSLIGFPKVYIGIRFYTDGDGATNKGVFLDNFIVRKNTEGQPDLTCSSFHFSPDNPAPGNVITLYSTFMNSGNAASPEIDVHFYLSADDIISEADYLLGRATLNHLDPLENHAIESILILPATLDDGEYYVGYFIDQADGLSESDENNNTGVAGNTITYGTSVAGQIALTSPNGSEEWAPNTSERILWQSSDVSNVNIEYSLNNGTSWETIASNISSTGLYTWNIPSIESVQCLIRITDSNNAGVSDASDNLFSIMAPVSVTMADRLPLEYALHQNSPNPFNPTTTIVYALPEPAHVSMELFNIHGEKVFSLVDSHQNPGYYTVQWDGRDDLGRPVSDGLYLCRFYTGVYSRTMRMLLLK
jgi:hypothetical protein